MPSHHGIDLPDSLKIGEFTYNISEAGYVTLGDGEGLGHIEECLEIGWTLWQLFESIDS